ncbi:hypothetical protein CUMW_237710 [Citrus unshiu]|nr:hypothetical protein CUMW_237710 [Citrus unshiu]
MGWNKMEEAVKKFGRLEKWEFGAGVVAHQTLVQRLIVRFGVNVPVELRAWRSTKGESLIPFADFLNHDGLSEAVVLHDEDKQLSEVIADRDYAPKEEVWITYGKFPNSTLLLDFGFSLPYNSYDEGAALSFKYYQHCFSSMKESVVLPSYELS